MKCSKCGRHLQSDSEDCPNCGEPVVYKLEKDHDVPTMIIAAVLTVGALMAAVIVLFNDGNYTLKKEKLFNEVGSVFSDSYDEEDYGDEQIEDEYDTEQQEGSVVQSYTSSESAPVKQVQTEEAPSYIQPVPVAAETHEYDEIINESYDETSEVYADWVEDFYQNYRSSYSEALNNIDFWQVEPYLSPEGTAYREMEEYLDDIKDYGSYFHFYTNSVTDYYVRDGMLYVETYEAFDLTDRDGNITSHQRDKIYTVILNYNYHPVLIDSIEITNHYR